MSKQIWTNGDDLLDDLREYIDYIEETDYDEVPAKHAFCDWVSRCKYSVDRRTLYNTLNIYFPDNKKEFMDIIGECLSIGCMKGKYKESITIFVLKNWCAYTDKQESKIDNRIEIVLPAAMQDLAK